MRSNEKIGDIPIFNLEVTFRLKQRMYEKELAVCTKDALR